MLTSSVKTPYLECTAAERVKAKSALLSSMSPSASTCPLSFSLWREWISSGESRQPDKSGLLASSFRVVLIASARSVGLILRRYSYWTSRCIVMHLSARFSEIKENCRRSSIALSMLYKVKYIPAFVLETHT
jgi:hypothetical protein